YVTLTVTDSGCGISEEIRGKIFEPYFTTKLAGKGSGLGLATVFGIVQQNSGIIIVDSTPGLGTSMQIYLPRSAAKPSAAKVATPASTPAVRQREHTILLVEDEPAILRVASRMLEKLGYRVFCAGSPHEGLRLAAEHADQLDLLITDIVMPDMNGRELADRLARAHPGLRTLFISGYAAVATHPQDARETAAGFLHKPFSAAKLAEAVEQALAASAQPHAPPTHPS
ncbi:MAG: response regulator, partial [Gemmatimonadaceae bacterium]